MNRTDVLREISSHVRRSHGSALFAVGWLALDLHQAALEDLLRALEELEAVPSGDDHLAAYRERFGRLPDPR